MSITIADCLISKISIIDDDAQARAASEFSVEEMGLVSVSEEGPFELLPECVKAVRQRADAAICDYHLKVHAYSTFNGAELTAEFYKAHFPAVLSTQWHTASIDEMRPYLRFIPLLVDPTKLNPSSIEFGIEACIREFNGEFHTVRRPWRTLVRIEDVPPMGQGAGFIYVVVPAWDSEVVRLPSDIMPASILETLRVGSRLHAKVNLGANGSEELFFEEWEI